ncbi:microtubule-associated tumor suppressor 1 homolog A [Anoplopoma fimbria]|uniref:microtubule-associated tumor suppressor 1 homolog A n=1 Tax=Anoplopoma fimbria TaxID=229290 RepID=UPI0023EDD40E|nr:microtubule-associated tumor suppressor 1 homolog A [Anoplopoma fimbria]XP_054454032.1 microtubule-associated tumor suppressor 1 homolog A [Anoplopoma fimbria]XP_054454033.1 microtubule-associated tumor suppressor 1 homolog A [Anoplopoma fimbria]XP_054454034.1 microtubule-associated tumor suppressor 1 homolog A [Anoplopoma fimbria]XP_054454035.1 microtubule-associated tumor suppressor 1 homolog A [Anoplopoma fimbria]
MSNKTFNMSTDQVESTVPQPNRETLSPESQCSNSSLSPSPDSNSSVSNLSDRETNSSPDVNMPECCLRDSYSYNTTSPQDKVLCGVIRNLNPAFIATPVDSSVNFWNENLSLMSNHATGLDKYPTFNIDTEDGSSSAVISPDSAGRESQLSSGGTSRCGSTENDCCSLSSGEMVIRSNSFCQENQSLLVVSSLEESSISLAAGHPAFPAESNLLLTTLPEVLGKSTERLTEENIDHLILGMTFTQEALPTEENDMAASTSPVALPSENEGGCLTTFLCESSPADCGKEAPFPTAEAELLSQFSGALTPVQGKTVLSTLSATQHTDTNIHTSTPVQNIGNIMPSLPSFSESSCTSNGSSPGLHPVKRQQISVTANCMVAGLPPSASKVKKMEIKKFPRPNFSSVKSKVVTRSVHQRSVSGPASLQRPSQVNNKHTEAEARAPIKSSPAKFRISAAAVFTPTKTINDAQRRVNTGAANLGVTFIQSSGHSAVDGLGKSRASPPFQQPAANKHASAVQCSNASSEAEEAALHSDYTREIKRISLTESSKSTTAGASSDERRSRFQRLSSPRQSRGAPLSQPPAASPRPATPSTRRGQGAQWRDEYRTSKAVGTPQYKQKNSTGSQRVQATGEPSLGTASTASIKLQLNGSRPPRPSPMGPPPTSRLPRKTLRPSRSLAESSVHSELSEGAGSTQVSGGPSHKPSPFKTLLKARLITTPGENTGPSLAPACKPAAPTSKGTSYSTVSPLRRTSSARLVRLNSSGPVDRSRQQHPPQQASQPNQRTGPPDVLPVSNADGRRKDQIIQQFRGLLAAGNCRFQAFVIVLQRTLAERDEATRQCRDLSQELDSLQGELVCSVHSSERLEKEKDELRVALQTALQEQQEQHQNDLAKLEQRLQAFYQGELDKVLLTYQEKTDQCKTLMQQQMGELKASHEAMKLELESSHAEQLQSVKQQYEMSLEELSKVHNQDLQSLERTLKETGAALSGQIEELTVENNAMIEKLTAMENRRKQLAEKSQKDSHTLYLEQELESLNVVLDIKNKQLHQQENKMMEINTLTDKNVKLDENLKKVQQENEDLKARMERHYALSRQLSTEQAVLQESLQKESKVNKRLSMEKEELMWKLHNGDLSSPRKVSPTSPSRSFSLQSPRCSDVFSSPPVSPR